MVEHIRDYHTGGVGQVVHISDCDDCGSDGQYGFDLREQLQESAEVVGGKEREEEERDERSVLG